MIFFTTAAGRKVIAIQNNLLNLGNKADNEFRHQENRRRSKFVMLIYGPSDPYEKAEQSPRCR